MIVDSISVKGDLILDSLTGKPYKVIKKKSVKVTTTLNDHTIAISYQLKGGVYRLSGNVNFDVDIPRGAVEGTYVLLAFQGNEEGVTVFGIGQEPEPILILTPLKLNFKIKAQKRI